MPTDSDEPQPPTVPPATLVEIWTDGGCKPNPGPGGWAAILQVAATVEKRAHRQPTRSPPTTAWNSPPPPPPSRP